MTKYNETQMASMALEALHFFRDILNKALAQPDIPDETLLVSDMCRAMQEHILAMVERGLQETDPKWHAYVISYCTDVFLTMNGGAVDLTELYLESKGAFEDVEFTGTLQ